MEKATISYLKITLSVPKRIKKVGELINFITEIENFLFLRVKNWNSIDLLKRISSCFGNGMDCYGGCLT
jgi:hypothetical protein